MERFERLVEAEQFEERGGWIVEAQFAHEMGSPYLLAHGIGEPVRDAETTVTIPEKGDYRVWVRTKDWVPEDHPGRFSVLIDGVPIPGEFGASGKDWCWELRERVHLNSGTVKLSLHDLTGFDGRCDAIYITNTTIVPPENADGGMRAWRKRLLGIPEEPEDAGSFDVIVVGGGIAGCAAAYTAGREGLRTALINDRPFLGGNASAEVGLTPEGKVTPVVAELSERQADGDIAAPKLFESMDCVQVFPNEQVFHVVKDGRKIQAVDSRNAVTGREHRFTAPLFIDCTGRAQLGVLAGAATMTGQESSFDFGESLAPGQADLMHHGNTVLFRTEQTGEPVDFPDVPWAKRVAKDHADLNGQIGKVSCLCGRGPYENQPGPYIGPRKIKPVLKLDGSWEHAMNLPKSHFWEYGQWLDPYAKGEDIRDHLLCAIIGTYANVREKDPEKYAGLKLVHLTHVMATGGFRRYLGDYILNEKDIREHTDFPDAVVENAGAFCLHYPGNKKYDFRLGNWKWVERDFKPYTVPFRCLYSADIDNLLAAGKHISATHIASSTVKLMGNCGQHGIAAGTAAALCLKYGEPPRELGRNHLDELKKRTEENQMLPR